MTKRVRDAGTGKIVAPSEAKARPKETISEEVGKDTIASLAKRLAALERALFEGRGRHARLLREAQRHPKKETPCQPH